jgi:hypothetical protein
MLDVILRRLDSMEEKLQPLGRHLAGVGGDGDGVLPVDDNSGALRVNGSSDMPSGGGGNATTLFIGAIGADSNLSAGDVLATIVGNVIGAICSGSSVAICDGASVTIGEGNLDATALRVGGDDGMNVLLGNCATVVLAGDDLCGAAIWHRPKHWQRRRRQRRRLQHSWRHQPRCRQQPRRKRRHGQTWVGQRCPRCARLERKRDWQ